MSFETSPQSSSQGHDIVVVGASAGGVESLINLVGTLPANFPGTLFVVLHMSADHTSALPAILARSGKLPASHPSDKQPFQPGQIYVASPDYHLLVEDGFVRVVQGPRENRHRPAVDPLFRTAALHYGPRVVGVILSGALDDGTAGLLAVKRRGGKAMVQDPDEALYNGMPFSALVHVAVDYCLPVASIGSKLIELAATPVVSQGVGRMSEDKDLEQEARMAELTPGAMLAEQRVGIPSTFSCPECHGVMWEIQDESLLRYRCRVGHALTANGMMAEQSEALETAMWVALKTLEENISLSRRLGQHASALKQDWLIKHYADRVQEGEANAMIIRESLMKSLHYINKPSIGQAAAPEAASGI